jgi:hypothetical protein
MLIHICLAIVTEMLQNVNMYFAYISSLPLQEANMYSELMLDIVAKFGICSESLQYDGL